MVSQRLDNSANVFEAPRERQGPSSAFWAPLAGRAETKEREVLLLVFQPVRLTMSLQKEQPT